MTANFTQSALRTLEIEIEQLNFLRKTLSSQSFTQACQLILACKGKVVCMGIGKSGHIARKISASLASTGTSAFYVHPCEAGHGDAGMITRGDLVIYISNSGESLEFNDLYPYLSREAIPIIAITNNAKSTLASKAEVTLLLEVQEEACPLKLAPTASTTNTLVLGDCLTVALSEFKQFTAQQFALSHPFGALGRRLLLTNFALMKQLPELPLVRAEVTIGDALSVLSAKNLGCLLIVGEPKESKDLEFSLEPSTLSSTTVASDQALEAIDLSRKANLEPLPLLGIFTDGDLKRVIAARKDLYHTPLAAVMNKNFTTVEAQALAFQSLQIMEAKRITVLPVVDAQQRVIGLVHFHDLMKSGI